ncbi:redox-sensitive transcriptional activator SoxR [Corynebacterium sp. A21]|uniref:redox-sensitive transcriptional activator SoxR n=1 Tax=Corynebacterium sp. A21 TaxID=3457318 RepID=UPI003FD07525
MADSWEGAGAADRLLSIGQVSARTGLAHSALHYYEKIGLIQSQRNVSNQRRYPRYMIRRITLIAVGRRLGISLEDIGVALARIPMDRRPSEEDWKQASEEWRSILEQRRLAIEDLESQLMGCIGCGCLSMTACELLNPADELAVEGPSAQRLRITHQEDGGVGEG